MPSITVRPQPGAPTARFFGTAATATDIATTERIELMHQPDGSFSAPVMGSLGRGSVWAVEPDGRVLDRVAYEGGDLVLGFGSPGRFGAAPAAGSSWGLPLLAAGVLAGFVAVAVFGGNSRA